MDKLNWTWIFWLWPHFVNFFFFTGSADFIQISSSSLFETDPTSNSDRHKWTRDLLCNFYIGSAPILNLPTILLKGHSRHNLIPSFFHFFLCVFFSSLYFLSFTSSSFFHFFLFNLLRFLRSFLFTLINFFLLFITSSFFVYYFPSHCLFLYLSSLVTSPPVFTAGEGHK